MSLLKTAHHGHKWTPRLVLMAAIFCASIVLCLQWQVKETQWLSQKSMNKLESLNMKHEMAVDSLFQEHWYLQADLFQTNTLDLQTLEKEDNQGLLVTIDSDIVDNGFLLLQPAEQLPEEDLQKIADHYQSAIPEFENVEIDQNIFLQGQPHYWVIPDELVRLTDEITEESEDEDSEIQPIQIGVIDSGIDASHSIFENVDILTGWNTISDDTNTDDDVGHGTHISGIISSEIDGIEIIPYKIVDNNGGRLSNVLEAFDKAIDDQPDIINASFGLLGPSYSLELIMEEAYMEGIIVVAAAGNNDSSKGFYPATYDTSLAVASVSPDGNAMDKSNYGNWIDLAANGYMVLSSIPDEKYGYKNGTSQAAALTSARVAELLTTDGNWTLINVLQALTEDSLQVEAGKLAGVAILD